MIELAIAEAIPHEPSCPAAGKCESCVCICGATGKRNVLYVRVQAHVSKLTRGRIYLNE